jgi:hypothetical protein
MPLGDLMQLAGAVSILLVAVVALIVLVKLTILIDRVMEKIEQRWPLRQGGDPNDPSDGN